MVPRSGSKSSAVAWDSSPGRQPVASRQMTIRQSAGVQAASILLWFAARSAGVFPIRASRTTAAHRRLLHAGQGVLVDEASSRAAQLNAAWRLAQAFRTLPSVQRISWWAGAGVTPPLAVDLVEPGVDHELREVADLHFPEGIRERLVYLLSYFDRERLAGG